MSRILGAAAAGARERRPARRPYATGGLSGRASAGAGPGPAGLAAQERDELAALALGEPADRLGRGDPALREDLVDLNAPVLGPGPEHDEHLRRLHVHRTLGPQLWE